MSHTIDTYFVRLFADSKKLCHFRNRIFGRRQSFSALTKNGRDAKTNERDEIYCIFFIPKYGFDSY